MSNEVIFSQAQLDFLEFVRLVLKDKMMDLWANDGLYFALAYMEGNIPAGGKEVCATFRQVRNVRLKIGMLTSIDFKWSGKSCRVTQHIDLHEPYYDENFYNGTMLGDDGVEDDFGAMVYDDEVRRDLSWTKAAWMLYHMVGIQKKSDRVKFVELVKAL